MNQVVQRIRSKFGTVSNFARLHGFKLQEIRHMIRTEHSDLPTMLRHAEQQIPNLTPRKLRGYVVMIYGDASYMARAEKISRKSVTYMLAGKKNIAWVRLISKIREGVIQFES